MDNHDGVDVWPPPLWYAQQLAAPLKFSCSKFAQECSKLVIQFLGLTVGSHRGQQILQEYLLTKPDELTASCKLLTVISGRTVLRLQLCLRYTLTVFCLAKPPRCCSPWNAAVPTCETSMLHPQGLSPRLSSSRTALREKDTVHFLRYGQQVRNSLQNCWAQCTFVL